MFSTTKIAAIAAVVLVALGYAWEWNNKNQEIKDLGTKNTVLTVENGSAKDTIQKVDASNKIDEATNVAVVQKTAEVTERHEKIKEGAEKKENGVKQDFGLKPPSPETDNVRDELISEIRIDGLWKAFCSERPAADGCIKTQ
jgi:hypothetical protein